MGEIADDHMVGLYWEEGTGIGGYSDEYGMGPIDDPAFGGMNAFLARRTSRIAAQYSCKFCGGEIKFINRRPYNMADGSAHTCLADAAKKAEPARPDRLELTQARRREQVMNEPWFLEHIEKVKADAHSDGYSEGYNEGYNNAQNDLTKED